MSLSKEHTTNWVGGQWREYKGINLPIPGFIFVGRNENKVYDKLFVMTNEDGGRVRYLGDDSIVLSRNDDWFTHWQLVGEIS